MLTAGITEEFTRSWSIPIMVVPKPDGSMRVSNNFLNLNKLSEFNSYPMPWEDKLTERLGRAQFTVHVNTGYHQGVLAGPPSPFRSAQDYM